ncbi:MAG: hypothetical protein ACQCN6_02560 [Candidatus Bathyarchaeia archaeon]|jgi:hypothetical protein
MTVNTGNVKENLAIGKISHFFGSKYGKRKIEKILIICGITEAPEGGKSEKISFFLKKFYNQDRESFVAFLETIIENHDLAPEQMEELRGYVRTLGYDVESSKLIPSSGKQILTSESKPYDVFRFIESLLLASKKRIFIIDAYVDDKLFTLYFDAVAPQVEIKILTKNMYAKFEEVSKKFKKQGRNFEVRTLTDIHDRHVIVDERAWLFGQSLKDAGNKPLSIVELDDVKMVEKTFSDLWNKGTVVV